MLILTTLLLSAVDCVAKQKVQNPVDDKVSYQYYRNFRIFNYASHNENIMEKTRKAARKSETRIDQVEKTWTKIEPPILASQ